VPTRTFQRSGVTTCWLLVAACGSEPTTYRANVEVVHVRPIRRDPATGAVLTVDVEISWFECPGEQRSTFRGDRDFAACIAATSPPVEPGMKVPVAVEHARGPGDDFRTQIHELAGCARHPDPQDEASYEVVQDCEDIVVNGVVVGVHCDRTRSADLLEACPWFRVR
jgi:hypothetical protein